MKPSPVGPPARDVFADQLDVPSTSAKLDEALVTLEQEATAADDAARYRGVMRFDHVTLVGPPIRLQGGLQCIGRLLPVLHRVATDVDVTRDALAVSLHLGAPIDLFTDVNFAAVHRSLPGGHHVLSTRLHDTPRLDGVVWTLDGRAPVLSDIDVDRWRDRHARLIADPSRQSLDLLSQHYIGNDDLLAAAVDFPAMRAAAPGLKRFVDHGTLSRAFLAYQLDNVGVLARAITLAQPCFTTQISLAFAAGVVAEEEPLVFLADRAGAVRDAHARARPVLVGNAPQGTQIVEVLAVDRAFRRVVGRGWVHSHPIDLSRMAFPR